MGCLAPSPSRSSRLHLAETRWFLVLPHRPLLVSRLSGFILCLPVLLFHALSLITMPFFSASLSLNLFLVALADGNIQFPSSGILSFFKLFVTSGLEGGRVRPLFYLLSIGGTEEKKHLKSLAVRHCSGDHHERSLPLLVI